MTISSDQLSLPSLSYGCVSMARRRCYDRVALCSPLARCSRFGARSWIHVRPLAFPVSSKENDRPNPLGEQTEKADTT